MDMTFADALQRVFELAANAVKTPEDEEAVDIFHDFVVNCPWLEEED